MADMIETMKSQKILKSCYANTKFLIIFFILVIVSTRAVTIGHNMLLHPDESVFFSASESLKQYLVGSAKEYEEEKEYPEGAIVLQLPFHIGGAVLRKIIGIDFSARLIGRISSVFYFSAGMVLGFIILDKFFSAAYMVLKGKGRLFLIYPAPQMLFLLGKNVKIFKQIKNIFYYSSKNWEEKWKESDLYMRYKGAFAENYVLNELKTNGIEPFFWRSGNSAEIDFIYEKNSELITVEVKSADNTQAKSYKQFCKKYDPGIGFKLSGKNIAVNMCEKTKTYSIPLYLTWNLDHYTKYR